MGKHVQIFAHHLVELLRKKHADDLFVDECKDGPTLGGGHQRLDAWAMPRSWSKQVFIGYEVKVSRQDFLGDQKWHGYLSLCNELYFVVAPGVCTKDELPAEVGLIEATSGGGRLITRRKAARREIEPPISLLLYVLICRAVIAKHDVRNDSKHDPTRYWLKWLEAADESKWVGHAAARRIAQAVERRCKDVQRENSRLQGEIRRADEVRDELVRHGLWQATDKEMPTRYEIARRVREYMSGSGLGERIKLLRRDLDQIEKFAEEGT